MVFLEDQRTKSFRWLLRNFKGAVRRSKKMVATNHSSAIIGSVRKIWPQSLINIGRVSREGQPENI